MLKKSEQVGSNVLDTYLLDSRHNLKKIDRWPTFHQFLYLQKSIKRSMANSMIHYDDYVEWTLVDHDWI